MVVVVAVVVAVVISFDHYCHRRSCRWVHHYYSKAIYCLESLNQRRRSMLTGLRSVLAHPPEFHFVTAEGCSYPGSGSLVRARMNSAAAVAPSSAGSSVSGGSCSSASCGSWVMTWFVAAAVEAKTVAVVKAVVGVEACEG